MVFNQINKCVAKVWSQMAKQCGDIKNRNGAIQLTFKYRVWQGCELFALFVETTKHFADGRTSNVTLKSVLGSA